MDDFDKGTRNDSSNVSNWREYERGREHRKNLDSISGGGLGGTAPGMVITGESPILQFIVRIPFLIAGTVFYPATLVITLIAGLICVRLMPLFGTNATWQRFLAYIPMLAVYWSCLRWDVRLGARHSLYRRGRHAARLLVFGLLGYGAAGLLPFARNTTAANLLSVNHVVGAFVGAIIGYFMLRSERWRDFWYATLAVFHIR